MADSNGGDSKYGRLFTYNDVVRLLGGWANVPPEKIEEIIASFTDGRFPPDEPLFVLLGRDKAAARTILRYRGEAEREGAGPDHIAGISAALERFLEFSEDHPDRMGVPD
jgi:hypothetical protein